MSEVFAVGKEALSLCGKCKLSLAHIIVTMKKSGKSPAKVECKTCKNTHAYKDPNKPVKATRKRKPKKEEVPLEEVWRIALAEAVGEPIKYSIKSNFSIGEVIEHPNFGQGVIENKIDNDKIEVIFETDIKMLVHNK